MSDIIFTHYKLIQLIDGILPQDILENKRNLYNVFI